MGEIHDLVERFGRNKALELIQDRAQRRLIDIASEVLQDENQAIGITYSGFCLTSLPHRRLADEQPWRRVSHRLTLMIEPGRLPGEDRFYGVPYGSRARLILLYLQTQALQNGSPEVELGRSMRDWMGRMGVTLGGQSYRDVREQANRISACRLTFSWQEGATVGFVRDNVVSGGLGLYDLHEDERQERLWVDTVRLSDNFYQALCRHPVPIWEPALRHIANRSMAIDVYIWLSYRLHSLRKATPITWSALHAQFGGGYKHLFQFKPRFAESLGMALAVYPEAWVEASEDGLLLHPSRPPVSKRTSPDPAGACRGGTYSCDETPGAPVSFGRNQDLSPSELTHRGDTSLVARAVEIPEGGRLETWRRAERTIVQAARRQPAARA